MTFYAMCQSRDCPSRRTCLRNAESGTQAALMQTYADFERHMDFSREARCPDHIAREAAQ